MEESPKAIRTKALKQLDRLPCLSPAVGRLALMSSGDEGDFKEMAQVVERDPALAGEFLHLANSGLYARSCRVVSVRHSLALVGMRAVWKYVIAFSFKRVFGLLRPARTFPLKMFNAHSAAVATMADLLAAELKLPDAESAFVAGLLHDLGRLLLAVTVPSRYQDPLDLAVLTNRCPLECERELLGIDHVQLSCAAVMKWELREPIPTAIAYHHAPENDPGSGVDRIPLSLVLAHADAWANLIGLKTAHNPIRTSRTPLEFAGREIKRVALLNRFNGEMRQLAGSLGCSHCLHEPSLPPETTPLPLVR